MTTKKDDTRYPYTYACDLIRSFGGYNSNGTKISRGDASQIRQVISKALNMNDETLANNLADYYLANQKTIDDLALKLFNLAQTRTE